MTRRPPRHDARTQAVAFVLLVIAGFLAAQWWDGWAR